MAWHGWIPGRGPQQPVACGERKGSLRSILSVCRKPAKPASPSTLRVLAVGNTQPGKKKRLKTCGLKVCRSLLGSVAARVAFSGRRALRPSQHPACSGIGTGFGVRGSCVCWSGERSVALRVVSTGRRDLIWQHGRPILLVVRVRRVWWSIWFTKFKVA